MTKLNFLNDPTLKALRSQFEIRDGRLHVQPFSVTLGGTTMTVSGSNGLDQSLEYNLGLRVPRSLLGADANQAIAGLMSKAAGAGIDLNTRGRDPARHPAGRHGHQSLDQDRPGELPPDRWRKALRRRCRRRRSSR